MKNEQLEYIINRYDHYYDSVNNKGQFYLGLNNFLIGGLGAAYTLIQQKECSMCVYAFMAAIFLIAFISIFFTLRAILPYLKSGDNNSYSSLIFFGSVGQLSRGQFLSKIDSINETDMRKDLAIQTHQLAQGLIKKFNWLKVAGILIAVEFGVLIPFLILFFKNIK